MMSWQNDSQNLCLMTVDLAATALSNPSIQNASWRKMIIAPFNSMPSWWNYTKAESQTFCSNLSVNWITGWQLVDNYSHSTFIAWNVPLAWQPWNWQWTWTAHANDFSSSYITVWTNQYSIPNDYSSAAGYWANSIVPFCVKYLSWY